MRREEGGGGLIAQISSSICDAFSHLEGWSDQKVRTYIDVQGDICVLLNREDGGWRSYHGDTHVPYEQRGRGMGVLHIDTFIYMLHIVYPSRSLIR